MRILAAALLAGFAAWTCALALTTDGFFEADEVNHYLYARHAPAHPANLLHPWARPLFTLVLMPFAQLGPTAARILSVICAVFAAASAALAARALGWRCWACAIPAAFAQPLFFQQTHGIWTEIMFAALLGGWALALAARRPMVLAAISAALPLVRPEGFLVAAVTGIAALAGAVRDGAGKPHRIAPVLIAPSGVILWATLGFAASGDPLWLPHHWPSDWAPAASYGSGSWTWLPGVLPQVVPVVLLPLAVLGAWAPGIRRAWPLLLVVAAVLGTHAILWKLGAFGSAGYPRYFVTLAPAFAILIAGGIEVLGRLLRAVPSEAFALATAGLAVFLLLRHPTATVPPRLPPDAALFAQVGRWIRNGENDPVLHSAHPFAYLEIPRVPAERFEDFGLVSAETLRSAPEGSWLLVEDRFYLTRRPANPGEAELPGLGFERIPVPDLGVDLVDLSRADPRHDPAIAGMHWALYRKERR